MDRTKQTQKLTKDLKKYAAKLKKDNKYLYEVFMAFCLYFVYNTYSKTAQNWKKENYKQYDNLMLNNAILYAFLPAGSCDFSKYRYNKAIETLKQYSNNIRKYA